MKTYLLKRTMTFETLPPTPAVHKPRTNTAAARAIQALVDRIAPALLPQRAANPLTAPGLESLATAAPRIKPVVPPCSIRPSLCSSSAWMCIWN